MFRCAACGEAVAIDRFAPWRCPRETGDRHHVLVIDDAHRAGSVIDDRNPFVRYLHRTAWWEFVSAHGMTESSAVDLVRRIDERVARVAGTGFRITPTTEPPGAAAAIGSSGRIFVKDETANVAGSHKARHLFSILLHVLAGEELGLVPWQRRPPLAISSCGNAAIAASTLAAAAEWPIDVFIPEWASGSVVDTLDRLGARVNRCPRRADDPPGDPTVHAFRRAVADGSIPFSVQGPENALCLDGGRTIGWEAAEQLRARGVASLAAVYAQVGGGAFAASLSRGLSEGGVDAPLVAVQTEGCAPLARAWNLAHDSTQQWAQDWTNFMWPWESEPVSVADGILDDETYDWVADFRQLTATHGRVVVVPEPTVVRAATLAPAVCGVDASPTGTAGFAGLLHDLERTPSTDHVSAGVHGRSADGDVLIVLSGVRRP